MNQTPTGASSTSNMKGMPASSSSSSGMKGGQTQMGNQYAQGSSQAGYYGSGQPYSAGISNQYSAQPTGLYTGGPPQAQGYNGMGQGFNGMQGPQSPASSQSNPGGQITNGGGNYTLPIMSRFPGQFSNIGQSTNQASGGSYVFPAGQSGVQ